MALAPHGAWVMSAPTYCAHQVRASAPNENSTDVFVLHEGVKVTLQEQRGEWALITLPDGKSGWMKRENLGII